MKPKLIPLQYEKPSLPEVAARARSFFEVMNRRRTVRDFSPARVPAGVIEDLVRAASTAPSGAHRQPWTFVAVSDPDIKRRIRIAAEREEHENYGGRMPDE
jgi:nitroreductase